MIKFLPLLLICGCLNLPTSTPPDLERGACVVTFPDRVICLEVPYLSCVASMGEFHGVGSTCDDLLSPIVEPTPLYLDKKVIASVGSTLTIIFVAWAGNKVRRKRGNK